MEVEEIMSKATTKAQAERARHLCGLPLSTYFSGMKMKWLLENVPEVRSAVEEKRCLFGTVDSWLIWVKNKYFLRVSILPKNSSHGFRALALAFIVLCTKLNN